MTSSPAIIVEPLHRCTPPRPGFLQGLRELTAEGGHLLIFDETVTGFRLAYGGAEEYYGVRPDLACLGKALGGGYPIGAVAGRSEVMDLVREDRLGDGRYVWWASSLGGNPVSSAAGAATLGELRKSGVYPRLFALGETLRSGLRRVLAATGVVGHVQGDGPLAAVVFTDREVVDYRSAFLPTYSFGVLLRASAEVEEIGCLEVGGQVLVLDVHARHGRRPGECRRAVLADLELRLRGREALRKVPTTYSTANPTCEWTASRFQVPVGRLCLVSVMVLIW